MKEKSEVFTHFQSFKAMVEKQAGKYVKCLRSDGGEEDFSKEFGKFLHDQGIQRQFTCRYTLQQNGVAEHKNCHIAQVARALMTKRNLPHAYWAKAINIVAYIMNRTPIVAIHNVMVKEKYTGKKPNLSHMKVFGCIAYVCTCPECLE